MSEDNGETFALGAASRLTGLSPELLRAWEKRYEVVTPVRTPGGTRRYRARDLERLRLVKAAVDAGHRIGQVARLDDEELARLGVASTAPSPGPHLEEILDAIGSLDAVESQRLLTYHLTALGPTRFARDLAAPLAEAIGERWAAGELSVAAEHLASSLLRNLLGAALQPTLSSTQGPRVLFATPPGEPHELGLQLAALTALGAGANPVYIGADLPVDELVRAVHTSSARALALSVVTLESEPALAALEELRSALDPRIRIWIGGSGAARLTDRVPAGVEYLDDLDHLERRIARLRFER